MHCSWWHYRWEETASQVALCTSVFEIILCIKRLAPGLTQTSVRSTRYWIVRVRNPGFSVKFELCTKRAFSITPQSSLPLSSSRSFHLPFTQSTCALALQSSVVWIFFILETTTLCHPPRPRLTSRPSVNYDSFCRSHSLSQVPTFPQRLPFSSDIAYSLSLACPFNSSWLSFLCPNPFASSPLLYNLPISKRTIKHYFISLHLFIAST